MTIIVKKKLMRAHEEVADAAAFEIGDGDGHDDDE